MIPQRYNQGQNLFAHIPGTFYLLNSHDFFSHFRVITLNFFKCIRQHLVDQISLKCVKLIKVIIVIGLIKRKICIGCR